MEPSGQSAAGPGAGQPTQYLTFQMAGETFAVSILQVKEILPVDTITRVPSTPRSIRGVMNLRGSVVPVVDLAVKIGFGESVVSRRSCVVIVEVTVHDQKIVMGILVDAVSQVIELRAEEIEPPPSFGTKVTVDCLIGMGRAGKRFILVLDIDRAIGLEEIAAAQTRPQPGQGGPAQETGDAA
ncbi:MAG: purine-binding chemotaxis protein CheW [Candidatus Riflebacteria bacterium]|nr:purine-binding chemotaxis protein CheW [Candidatus Riflebacteria bacterium]